jgi:hypothetical protein
MAAYEFVGQDFTTGIDKQFMFGNLDCEVDLNLALRNQFVLDEFHDLSGDSGATMEQINEQTKIAKVDLETMTAVIVVEDDFLGTLRFVGHINQI